MDATTEDMVEAAVDMADGTKEVTRTTAAEATTTAAATVVAGAVAEVPATGGVAVAMVVAVATAAAVATAVVVAVEAIRRADTGAAGAEARGAEEVDVVATATTRREAASNSGERTASAWTRSCACDMARLHSPVCLPTLAQAC